MPICITSYTIFVCLLDVFKEPAYLQNTCFNKKKKTIPSFQKAMEENEKSNFCILPNSLFYNYSSDFRNGPF